jgi:hypothetical protein
MTRGITHAATDIRKGKLPVSEKIDVEEAEAIPPASPEPKKRGRPKGGKNKPKLDAAGNPLPEAEKKPKKKEAPRMAVPPVWNRMIADLPYAVVPILQARTGLPIVEQLPMVDGAKVTIDKRTVEQMYESGRAAFDEWMLSFGGLKVHPAVAYFGSVLCTVGMAGYLSYLKVQELALQAKIMEMARASGQGATVVGLDGRPIAQEVQPDTTVTFNGVHVEAEPQTEGLPPPTIV